MGVEEGNPWGVCEGAGDFGACDYLESDGRSKPQEDGRLL